MRDPRDMMVERQAEIISSQNEQLRTIKEKHDAQVNALRREIKEMRVYSEFYKKLQETILSNPTLINEWQSFMLLVKMIDPDQDKYEHARYNIF